MNLEYAVVLSWRPESGYSLYLHETDRALTRKDLVANIPPEQSRYANLMATLLCVDTRTPFYYSVNMQNETRKEISVQL